jgi:hypothetical protein
MQLKSRLNPVEISFLRQKRINASCAGQSKKRGRNSIGKALRAFMNCELPMRAAGMSDLPATLPQSF